MLIDRPCSGENRGREFYDGRCQSCDGGYETHTDDCEWAALIAELGGPEAEAKRHAERLKRREDHARYLREDTARRERERKSAEATRERLAKFKEQGTPENQALVDDILARPS